MYKIQDNGPIPLRGASWIWYEIFIVVLYDAIYIEKLAYYDLINAMIYGTA